MNAKLNSWLSIMITAIVGVMFTVWAKETALFSWLVRGIGVCMILPGMYVFIQAFGKKSAPQKVSPVEIDFTMPENPQKSSAGRSISVSLLIASVCTVLLGLWLVISPEFFITLFAILIASLLIVYGLYQLVLLIYSLRSVKLPWYFFVVPSLFVIAGVVILATPVLAMNYIVSLTTGILLILSALNAAVQKIMLKN